MSDGGRGPQRLDVPVAPVGGGRSRRGRGAALVAGVVLAGALVAAVALAQAFPAEPVQTAVDPPASQAAAPSPSGDAVSPAPASPVIASPRRLTPAQLVAGVLDRSLDGWLVYADADFAPCAAPCADTTIAGVGLSVTGARDEAAAGGTPDAAVLVLRVDGDNLAYLGSLIVHRDGSPSLETLAADVAAGLRQGTTLFDARGWLILPRACVGWNKEGTCPPVSPWLADEPPGVDGIIRSDRGEPVAIDPQVWGLAPTDTLRGGPFLVRPIPGDPRWEVVARYDPSRSVRVVAP